MEAQYITEYMPQQLTRAEIKERIAETNIFALLKENNIPHMVVVSRDTIKGMDFLSERFYTIITLRKDVVEVKNLPRFRNVHNESLLAEYELDVFETRYFQQSELQKFNQKENQNVFENKLLPFKEYHDAFKEQQYLKRKVKKLQNFTFAYAKESDRQTILKTEILEAISFLENNYFPTHSSKTKMKALIKFEKILYEYKHVFLKKRIYAYPKIKIVEFFEKELKKYIN